MKRFLSKRSLRCFLALATILCLSQPSHAKTHVFGMYGLFGSTFSGGMEQNLARKLRKGGEKVVPPTTSWVLWPFVLAQVNSVPAKDKVVVVGHSMGANAAEWVQYFSRRNIDLVVAYDPTIWSIPAPIVSKTKRAVCYYSTNWSNFVGHQKCYPRWGYTGRLDNIPTATTHALVDDDNALHDYTLKQIDALGH